MMPPNTNRPPQPTPAPQPTGGQMPPQGQGRSLPPELLQRMPPMQRELVTRLSKLSPQEGQALINGISPQAAAALKKLLPELGFLIDKLHQGGGMPPPGGGAPQPAGGGQPPMPPQGGAPGPRRPKTALGGI